MPAGRSGNTAIVLTRVLNLGSRSVRRRRPSPVRVGPNRWPTGGQLLLISRFARGPRDAGGRSPAPRRAPRRPRGPKTVTLVNVSTGSLCPEALLEVDANVGQRSEEHTSELQSRGH